jgi:hypothetical protein
MQYNRPHETPSQKLRAQLKQQRDERAQVFSAFDETYRQVTGKIPRLKTRLTALESKQTTDPILMRQPNPSTPWHGVDSRDIFDTPTLHMEAIKIPAVQEVSPMSAKNMHDTDIPPEQDMVYVTSGKWHFDSPAHMPDRSTLNTVLERYYLDFHHYPSKLEVSEGFYAHLCLFNLLDMQEDRALFRYKDWYVQIVPNFWAPFWCISTKLS